MEQYVVKIKSIGHITHDVLKIVTDKPPEYNFAPGQATEIAINKTGWADEKRPFSFTSMPVDDYLEFTIKTYPSHNGVTNQLLNAQKDDELILHDVFGAITYFGEGLFIAGGAGVTPFICILRNLQLKNEIRGNKLIFANKTKDDIILKTEFEKILGDKFVNILSEEVSDRYAHGFVNEEFLKANIDDFTQQFYVCGPLPMIDAVTKQLANLGVSEKAITIEKI